jgi:hypothetical protein
MIICYVSRESRSLINCALLGYFTLQNTDSLQINSKLSKVTTFAKIIRFSSVMYIMIYYG